MDASQLKQDIEAFGKVMIPVRLPKPASHRLWMRWTGARCGWLARTCPGNGSPMLG
jgi:hypothetical protein